MSKNQVSESVILNKIQNSDCCFHLTSDDIVELSQEGVSDTIINKMIYVMERARTVKIVQPTRTVVVRPRVQVRYAKPKIQVYSGF